MGGYKMLVGLKNRRNSFMKIDERGLSKKV
jgi:hypothetical protein